MLIIHALPRLMYSTGSLYLVDISTRNRRIYIYRAAWFGVGLPHEQPEYINNIWLHVYIQNNAVDEGELGETVCGTRHAVYFAHRNAPRKDEQRSQGIGSRNGKSLKEPRALL